jgi:hypothetical protein
MERCEREQEERQSRIDASNQNVLLPAPFPFDIESGHPKVDEERYSSDQNACVSGNHRSQYWGKHTHEDIRPAPDRSEHGQTE